MQDGPTRGNNLVLAYVVVIILTVGASYFFTQNRVDRNADLTKIMIAVTGCQPVDTPEQCKAKVDEIARQQGVVRVYEVDCRFRRALLALPAQPPEEKCVMP